MSMTIRDLERLYEELKFRREDLLDIIEDSRSTDLEYNGAKRDLVVIERELDDIVAELEYQDKLSSSTRERSSSRSGSSLGSSAFNNGRSNRGGRTAEPIDELGSVRIKNQSSRTREPVSRHREPVTRDNITNNRSKHRPEFKTKVRDTSMFEYAVGSLYPYILSENVKIKEFIKGDFKERELVGISKDDSVITVNKLEITGDEEIDFIKYLSSEKSCNFIKTCNTLYETDINNTDPGVTKIGDLLLNGDSLERKFGLPNKLTPIINNHICAILNDALVLNNSTVIIKDMSDFKELLETFTDTPTTVLKEIKNSVNHMEVTIVDKTISIESCTPVIYGFPLLEAKLGNHEAAFISENSSPKLFNALSAISNECESNIINLITTTGSKYRIVISTIHQKAVIRKDNIS